MHIHQFHPYRRHDDPAPKKILRSLIFFLSALLFATAVFGFLRDAKAQFHSYSLPNGAGGWNYHSAPGYGYGDNSDGMLGLGLGMMNLANQNQIHQRQMAAQYGYYNDRASRPRRYVPRETWTPRKARANWGRMDDWR